MRSPNPKLKGLILAGGFARRFGGGKCQAILASKPLISWVFEALKPFCNQIGLSIRPEMKPEHFGIHFDFIVYDEYPGAGPAAAINSALKKQKGVLLVTPCDQPFLIPNLLENLKINFFKGGSLNALAFSDEKGRLLPFPGIYREPLCFASSLKEIFERCRSQTIPPEIWRNWDPLGLSFFNVNRKEDLEKAAELFKLYQELCRRSN